MHSRILMALILHAFCFATRQAQGILPSPERSVYGSFENNKAPASKILINPFIKEHLTHLHPPSLGASFAPLDFSRAIKKFLKKIAPGIKITLKEQKFHQGVQSLTHTFQVNNMPFCGYELRSHHASSQATFILGSIPEFTPNPIIPDQIDWPLEADILSLVASSFSDFEALPGAERCILLKDDNLIPVWQMTILKKSLPYQLTLDSEKIYEEIPLFFDADKPKSKRVKVAAWEPNAYGRIANFTQEIFPGSLLENQYFSTYWAIDHPRVRVGENGFIGYSSDDLVLDETSIFVHANNHLNYFFSIGFDWMGGAPIQLRLKDNRIAEENNARYIPARATVDHRPWIAIGEWDGFFLQNLETDKDVVSHELGHHVIFRTLASTNGESRVLHEGLADFFAFLAQDDPCLAESVCPEYSPLCYLPSQCLRTGENDLKYRDDRWLDLYEHQKGQVISGMLWDLRSKIKNQDLGRLVLHAVSLLSANSGYQDLFIALLFADNTLYQGKYGGDIYKAIEARGFGPLVEHIDYKDKFTWNKKTSEHLRGPNGQDLSTPPSGPAQAPGFCGAVATRNGKNSKAGLFLWFSLLALHVLARKRFSI